MAHPCENCKIRAHYDAKPKSLMGRFWRWHINFCSRMEIILQIIATREKG